MTDEFTGLPDAVAVRARHFKESDPGISKAEAVTRAMNDPSARRAYAADVTRHERRVNTGTAEGPQEPRQYREGVGINNGEGKGPPSRTPYYEAGLGPILEQALKKIMADHPEYTRAQAIVEAMKIPHVAAAYENDQKIQQAQPGGSHL